MLRRPIGGWWLFWTDELTKGEVEQMITITFWLSMPHNFHHVFTELFYLTKIILALDFILEAP